MPALCRSLFEEHNETNEIANYARILSARELFEKFKREIDLF